jgi:hypothetical protein
VKCNNNNNNNNYYYYYSRFSFPCSRINQFVSSTGQWPVIKPAQKWIQHRLRKRAHNTTQHNTRVTDSPPLCLLKQLHRTVAIWIEYLNLVNIVPLWKYSVVKLQCLPSSVTPLFYLSLLHVSAVLTGHYQVLCTSYKTYV